MKLHNWQHINNETDVHNLIDSAGYFHDACVREIHMYSTPWVREDLSMIFERNIATTLGVLVQRQASNFSAIEMIFEGLKRFNWLGVDESWDGIILSSKLELNHGLIYWALNQDWQINDPNKDQCSWLSATKLKWRDDGCQLSHER